MEDEVCILPEDYLPNIAMAGCWMGVTVSEVSGPLLGLLRSKFETSRENEIANVRFYAFL